MNVTTSPSSNYESVTTQHHFRAIHYAGLAPGPRVIILGAVHGNEICGTKAIEQIIAEIDSGALKIVGGSVTFIPVTNPLAYARGQRMGDRNLNRNLYPTVAPVEFEDHIANWLCPLLAQHDVLLDLHSFHTRGEAFAMVGPDDNAGTLEPFSHAEAERRLAFHLGVKRFVDGWLDTYARGVERRVSQVHPASGSTSPNGEIKGSTYAINTDARYGVGTTEYMRSVGGYALTLECGQHDDPLAPQRGYRAILNTLALLGITGNPAPEPVTDSENFRLYDVIDRAHSEDSFQREWASFDVLKAGDVIGTRQDGTEICAVADGLILFPNPKALPGQEWFYLAKKL